MTSRPRARPQSGRRSSGPGAVRRLVHPIRVRLAQAADIPLLPDIERSAAEAFRTTRHAWVADDSVTEAEAYHPLIAAQLVWVAEDDSVLAGFVSTILAGDALHVLELAVHLDHQRKGIGRRLMQAVIYTARTTGLRAVTLTTFLDVAFNAPFYGSMGFDILDHPPARLLDLLSAETQRGLTHRCAMRLNLRHTHENTMKPTQASIAPQHQITAQQIDALEDRLYEFNAARTGYSDAAQLAFLAEVDGELVGAVAGFSWGGTCELRQVWVDKAHRGRGLGRQLMDKAIEEARKRGCAHVFLATYDFQAPEFYAKLGFRPVAEIPGKPLGHTDIVMRLTLDGWPS